MEYVPVPAKIRNMIEHLVEISKDVSGPIPETSKDWEIVVKVYELWRTFFPNEYKDFIKSAEMFRENHLLSKGISNKGEEMLQHMLEVPEYLYHLIRKVYPGFKFDKKLTEKFVSVLPEFDVT